MRSILRTLFACLACGSVSAALPQEPNFTDAPFANGLSQPTCIAWAPDGSNRLFVSLKADGIGVVKDGQLQDPLFAVLQPYFGSECGVLGLAFDPNYTTNHW